MRTSLFSVVAASFIASAANADDLTDLAIFKSGGIQSGLWRMELLDGSADMLKAMKQIGNVSLCADMAEQIAKSEPQDEADSCKPRILSNKADAAEIELACEDGDRSLVKFFKEGARSYIADVNHTPKDEPAQRYKVRYSYQGECKEDASIFQLDKNSEACKKMGNVDVASLCAKAPEQYRAQCEEQAKLTAGMCK